MIWQWRRRTLLFIGFHSSYGVTICPSSIFFYIFRVFPIFILSYKHVSFREFYTSPLSMITITYTSLHFSRIFLLWHDFFLMHCKVSFLQFPSSYIMFHVYIGYFNTDRLANPWALAIDRALAHGLPAVTGSDCGGDRSAMPSRIFFCILTL
jgi:hypothetical protein